MSARRLAIVVPRYGSEVNGGAEVLARQYAHHLAVNNEVTVLTTCALDYRTWADHFPPRESMDGGVRVVRFPVPIPRDEKAFDAMSTAVLTARTSRDAELNWMDAQGPVAPELEQHLRDRGSTYDAVLFIPYLYATTFRGLPIVADRAILIPALHDEPPLRLSIFDELISAVRALVFSTPEEEALARGRFQIADVESRVVGAGIDMPARGDTDSSAQTIGVERPYVLSLGRIDPSKGSLDLIAMHREYRSTRPNGLDLVMLGRPVVDLPAEPWLHAPGFVPDEVKHGALAGCVALASASPFESLSLVLLEAWSHGRPVIVTTRSDVLVGQTRRAQGGLWFSSATEYAACVDLLASRPPLAWGLGRSGWRFASQMGWPEIVRRLESVIDSVAER